MGLRVATSLRQENAMLIRALDGSVVFVLVRGGCLNGSISQCFISVNRSLVGTESGEP